MLVQNSIYRNTYLTDGVNKDFYFSFPILESSQVLVQTSPLTDTSVPTTVDPSQYTVTGVGLTTGGHISFNTAPPTGSRIALTLNIPITQLYQYAELDSFPAKSHENALAKLTLICQQLREQISRAVVISATSEGTSADLINSIFEARDAAQASAATAGAGALAADTSASAASTSASAAKRSANAAAANSAGLITEVQNLSAMCAGKANLDMDNLTQAGTTAIAHFSGISGRSIAASLPSSGSDTAPAPSDGVYHIYGRSSASGQLVAILHKSSGVSWQSWTSGANQDINLILDVGKGDVCTVYYTTTSNNGLRFVYKKGAY